MGIDSEWFGLIGVLIGGGITFVTQQFRIQADVKQAHNDKVDNDLRLFQEAVWNAINAQEEEIGTLAEIMIKEGSLGIGDWLPIETYQTLQRAEMLATRVRNKHIRTKWRQLHKLLDENQADVQRSTYLLKKKSPEKAVEFYTERSVAWFSKIVRAREGYKVLNEAIDAVFD